MANQRGWTSPDVMPQRACIANQMRRYVEMNTTGQLSQAASSTGSRKLLWNARSVLFPHSLWGCVEGQGFEGVDSAMPAAWTLLPADRLHNRYCSGAALPR
jgi:hypothetical protein